MCALAEPGSAATDKHEVLTLELDPESDEAFVFEALLEPHQSITPASGRPHAGFQLRSEQFL